MVVDGGGWSQSTATFITGDFPLDLTLAMVSTYIVQIIVLPRKTCFA